MNASAAFWVVASGVILILFIAVVFARRVTSRQKSSSARTKRAAWIVAAATSTSILASIAVTVAGLERAVTMVDVIALVISGVIAGVLLTRGPAYRGPD